MAKSWSYFDKFEKITDKYMPRRGEGGTLASQAVTAVNKLVYKWYNDGDVFDNTHALEGWMNDLSTYANWLDRYIPETKPILEQIDTIGTNGEYEDLLAELADLVLDWGFLEDLSKKDKSGSIYTQKGPYEYKEFDDDEDCEDDVDWEEWDEED